MTADTRTQAELEAEALSEAFAASDALSEIDAAEAMLSAIADGNERVAAMMASTFLDYLRARRARS